MCRDVQKNSEHFGQSVAISFRTILTLLYRTKHIENNTCFQMYKSIFLFRCITDSDWIQLCEHFEFLQSFKHLRIKLKCVYDMHFVCLPKHTFLGSQKYIFYRNEYHWWYVYRTSIKAFRLPTKMTENAFSIVLCYTHTHSIKFHCTTWSI